MKTHLALLLYFTLSLAFAEEPAPKSSLTPEDEYVNDWVNKWEAASEKAAAKYAVWGATLEDSAFSLLAAGLFDHWSNTHDFRLNDPVTGPEALFAEALLRLQRVQSSGQSAEARKKNPEVEALTISLNAAKNERARLLNYIANLESGASLAQAKQQEYERGWNEAIAQVNAATPAQVSVTRPTAPVASRSLTNPGPLTAPNSFRADREAAAKARKGPPLSDLARQRMADTQRQGEQAARDYDLERRLNSIDRKLGQ